MSDSSNYNSITESSRDRDELLVSDSTLYSSLGDVGYQEETSSGGVLGSIKDAFTDLGDLVWNDRREPVPIYNFFVRGEMGLLDAPCKSVRAFTREFDYEEIQEGGRNDYVILKRKPITHRYTLQLERYVGMDVVDPFALGTEFVAPLLIGVKRILPLTSGFADTMENTELIRLYTFTGCIVTGKEYGQLDAEKSGLLTETVTIAYREMICLTTPNADNVVEHWKVSDYDDTSKDSLKRAKSETLLKSWEAVDPTVYKWNVGKDTDGKTDLNVPEKRSAQRPVGDSSLPAKVKKWNVGKDVEGLVGGRANLNVPANRSAQRNDDLDEAKPVVRKWGVKEEDRIDTNKSAQAPAVDKNKAEVRKWNIGKDSDNKTDLNKPENRSAVRNDALDEAKAKGKSWGVLPNERSDAKKSAQAPTGDKNKGKPKRWDVHEQDKNKSAKTPPGDTRKSKKKSWDITKRKKNKRAVNPAGDDLAPEGKSWDIKEKGENKSATPPAGDDVAPEGRTWDINYRGDNKSAPSPSGDDKAAEGKVWDINDKAENMSANHPADDEKAASGSTYAVKARQEKRAQAPAGDSDPAKGTGWDIKKPDQNRHAVIMKNAEDIAKFLSR